MSNLSVFTRYQTPFSEVSPIDSVANDTDIPTIGAIVEQTRPAAKDSTFEQVARQFSENLSLPAIAIVESSIPIGLVDRQEFYSLLSKQFGWALYSQHPVSEVMDPDPLIVEMTEHIDTVETIIANEMKWNIPKRIYLSGNSIEVINVITIPNINNSNARLNCLPI